MHRSRGRRAHSTPAHRRTAQGPAETAGQRAPSGNSLRAPSGNSLRPPSGNSLRRLMVTPTFVFSVSILTVAALAFGTTQTYLRFSSAGPGPGCAAQGCANPEASHSAGGGTPDGPMAAGAAHKPGQPSPSPGKGVAGTSRHQAGSRPEARVSYHTTHSIPGGFVAEISITYRGGSPDANWWLSFTYPGVRVVWIAGVAWHADGGTIVVEPVPGAPPLRKGTTLLITLAAMGDPGPPSGCLFDGARCHIAS
jgi:Cellulose binding domain